MQEEANASAIGGQLDPAPSHSELPPIYGVTAGLDVHKSNIVVCVLGCGGDPNVYSIKTFGTFKKNIRLLTAWLVACGVELAVMESTGIYWRIPYNMLKEAGVNVILANARNVKNLPGRKSDVEDSRWLAMLARAGLTPKSRILEQDQEEMRELSRMR
jgi:transposase